MGRSRVRQDRNVGGDGQLRRSAAGDRLHQGQRYRSPSSRCHAAGRPLRSSLALLVPCRIASPRPGLPEAMLLWLLAHQEVALARTHLDLPHDGQGSAVWEGGIDTQDVSNGMALGTACRAGCGGTRGRGVAAAWGGRRAPSITGPLGRTQPAAVHPAP